ncbi:MAG TPA: glycosyltransferase family 2 protein [Candidatus Dormibacteraeota bacterium]
MRNPLPLVAIVIPAHNEERHLPGLLSSLPSALAGASRVIPIVVDDGSRDGTARLARAAAGVRVVRHRVRLGKGAALKTGSEAALRLGAGVIVVMDGDGQHRAGDLPRLVAPLIRGEAEVVLGTRPLSRDMPATLRFGNGVLNFAIRALFGIRLGDSQGGFRAFTAAAYEKLRWQARGYAVESEMLVHMARQGLTFLEVPIDVIYHDRHKGTQPLDGLHILRHLLAWRLGH